MITVMFNDSQGLWPPPASAAEAVDSRTGDIEGNGTATAGATAIEYEEEGSHDEK